MNGFRRSDKGAGMTDGSNQSRPIVAIEFLFAEMNLVDNANSIGYLITPVISFSIVEDGG